MLESLCLTISQKAQDQILKKEFSYFLGVARRSTFENASILIVIHRRKLITDEKLEKLLDKLDKECRMITNFKKSL